MERVGDVRRVSRLQKVIRPVEVDERDADLSMLRLGDVRQKRLADRNRDTSLQHLIRELGQHPHRRNHVSLRRRSEESPFSLRHADGSNRERVGKLRTDDDLPRLRGSLHLNDARGAGPGDDELSVRLADQTGWWRLSIVDQGAGFDSQGVAAPGTGVGLVNMRDRLEAVGGNLSVQSRPGRSSVARDRDIAALSMAFKGTSDTA